MAMNQEVMMHLAMAIGAPQEKTVTDLQDLTGA